MILFKKKFSRWLIQKFDIKFSIETNIIRSKNIDFKV